MKTVTEALSDISEVSPSTEVRIARRINIGGVIRQGDVYLHRVKADHPRGAELGTKQVAVGEGVGSRHVVEGEGVCVYAGKNLPEAFHAKGEEADAMLGPVVYAPEGVTLTHPEHAHHRLPKGTYQVTYQFDLSTLRRVVD